jgi:hypothetical protein
MAGILVPYVQFLEIRQRRHRVRAAIDEQAIENPPVAGDRPSDEKPADPPVPTEGTLVTNV